MLEYDDIKPIMYFLILVAFIFGLIGFIIGDNKSERNRYKEDFTMLSAINSPIFIPTRIVGTMFIKAKVPTKEEKNIIDLAEAIIECESGNEMVWGDTTLKYPAYGVAQFQERTWNWMKELSGMYWLNYNSPQDQKRLLIWALSNGYGSHWACYNKIAYK